MNTNFFEDNIAERDKRDAMMLFEHLQEDLDPTGFTINEIIEEGWDGRHSLPDGSLDAMSQKARYVRTKRLMNYLIRKGLVERHEDADEKVFCLTEAGYNQRFEVN